MSITVRFNIGSDVADRMTLQGFQFDTKRAAEQWVREVAAVRYPLADNAVLIQGGSNPFSIHVKSL